MGNKNTYTPSMEYAHGELTLHGKDPRHPEAKHPTGRGTKDIWAIMRATREEVQSLLGAGNAHEYITTQ